MREENIPLSNVVQHNYWSGKNCPTNLRNGSKGINWNQFIAMVGGASGATSPSQSSYLKLGDTGDEVRLYQDKLKRAGYNIAIDGSFGNGMLSVVKQFQRDNNLVVDGYLGSATKKKLDEILIALRPTGKPTGKTKGEGKMYKPSANAITNSTAVVLRRLEQKSDKPLDPQWREKLLNGELTESDAIGLIFVAIERGHIVGE